MRRRRSESAWALKQKEEPTQREVLRDVLLTAAKYDAWLTLKELARFTRFGEASISAQLRHLRKARYGGFEVTKRQRPSAVADAGGAAAEQHGPVWEYRLAARKRAIRRRRRPSLTARRTRCSTRVRAMNARLPQAQRPSASSQRRTR
jgi:hypothetical protein